MASNNNNNNDKAAVVVIVGGGPSGAAAAKAMADRGFTHIDLYEAYPHPKSLSKTSSKAYVIALNPRGQQGVLDSTGIDLLKAASNNNKKAEGECGVVSNGMARHVYNPKTKQTSTKIIDHMDSPSLIIPRQALTGCLLDAANESGVNVHYQHRLVDVDFENCVATFAIITTAGGGDDDGISNNAECDDEQVQENKSTTTTTTKMIDVKYDLLIGADGCNSKVRNLMVKNNNSLSNFTARTEEDSMEYQVVVLPESPFDSDFPEGTVHSWNNKELNAICLGFPMKRRDSDNDKDDKNKTNSAQRHSMLFAIVFPEGKLESFRRSDKSSNDDDDDGYYRDNLTKLLPDLFRGNDEHGEQRLSAFIEQLQENQIANGGLCVWSSSLGHVHNNSHGGDGGGDDDDGGGGIILLGDSGHGMWPSLGQGANCALESVAVFARCLDELLASKKTDEKDSTSSFTSSSSTSWTNELVQRFQHARFEDATAAVDLTYGGIGARTCRGRQNAPLSYKLQIIGMMLLHKLTFGIVPMPALLRLMMGSKELSYSTAKRYNFHYEKCICLGGALFLTIATTVVIPRIWSQLRGSPDNSGNEL